MAYAEAGHSMNDGSAPEGGASGVGRQWCVKDILDWCQSYLERCGDENPRLSAEWLLAEALGMTRIDLYLNYAKPLSASERSTMREWVRRRGAGEPLQLISGYAPFRHLSLKVAAGVLIPRPETEVLVSEAMNALDLPSVAAHVVSDDDGVEETLEAELPALRVLDLCTGSGCIACSIASEYPAAHVVAIDIDPAALDLARKNVDELGLGEKVEVLRSDLLQELAPNRYGNFDLVISNPPYVPTAVCQGLESEVLDYDPMLALDGGEDGLALVRRFAGDAFLCLKPGGLLALELYEGHMDKAKALLEKQGFVSVLVKNDLTGRPRVILARRPESSL